MPDFSEKEDPGVGEFFDFSELLAEVDETGMFNLETAVLELSTGTSATEIAGNAVVRIRSPWAEGFGFFISNRGHILTSKSLVSYSEDENDPVWKEQQQIRKKLEWVNKAIETQEERIANSRLSDRQYEKAEAFIEQKKEEADDLERQLDEYNGDLEIVAMDDSHLDVVYVNESENYNVALLTIEEIKTPALKPFPEWPTNTFYRNVLDRQEKVYTIGNVPEKDLAATPSIVFRPGRGKKCCYKLQHLDVFEFSSNGSPLITSSGEVLGVCSGENYMGEAVPIITAINEFRDILGLGEKE